jgi:hypothetical protein
MSLSLNSEPVTPTAPGATTAAKDKSVSLNSEAEMLGRGAAAIADSLFTDADTLETTMVSTTVSEKNMSTSSDLSPAPGELDDTAAISNVSVSANRDPVIPMAPVDMVAAANGSASVKTDPAMAPPESTVVLSSYRYLCKATQQHQQRRGRSLRKKY